MGDSSSRKQVILDNIIDVANNNRKQQIVSFRKVAKKNGEEKSYEEFLTKIFELLWEYKYSGDLSGNTVLQSEISKAIKNYSKELN